MKWCSAIVANRVPWLWFCVKKQIYDVNRTFPSCTQTKLKQYPIYSTYTNCNYVRVSDDVGLCDTIQIHVHQIHSAVQLYTYSYFLWVGTRNGIFSMKPHSSNPNPARLMLTMEKWLFSRWTWVSRYLLRQRMMDVCGDSCSYRSCKAPVKSSPTNQHQVFYRPDALPIAQPTVSKHWRENITSYGLAYPKLIWGSSNFVFGH